MLFIGSDDVSLECLNGEQTWGVYAHVNTIIDNVDKDFSVCENLSEYVVQKHSWMCNRQVILFCLMEDFISFFHIGLNSLSVLSPCPF